jgi:glycosyltransferase involved in cell wall biosynthesis
MDRKLDPPANQAPAPPSNDQHPVDRLGVYIDSVYRVDKQGDRSHIYTDRSFLLFVCRVGDSFDRLVLLGRTTYGAGETEYLLPEQVALVPLPHYSNLRQITEVLASAGGTLAGFWRGLRQVDTLWVFGPHPFAVMLVGLALLRRKRVVLGVRQNSVGLYAARVAGWKKIPALSAVRILDGIYRLAARRFPVTVQGAELAHLYGGDREGVLVMNESIVSEQEVLAAPPKRDWSAQIELLTVGRLETEKNPLLLIDALGRLDGDEPGRFRLTWVGRGPLEDQVRRRAAELGIEHLVEFKGYVPFNEGLLDMYRRAHIFVHVSLSEGMPKVLIEALASASAIVATDVGGVRAAMRDGAVAELVPPDDLQALVAAVKRIVTDEARRSRLIESGLEAARELTLERQADRVVRFIEAATKR